LTPQDWPNWPGDKQDGLLPAIVQDARDLRVLMLGYMNREALAETLASGKVTFYSRSKQRLWTKGESSGHVLALGHRCRLRQRHRAGAGHPARPHLPPAARQLLPRCTRGFPRRTRRLGAIPRRTQRPARQLHHSPVRVRNRRIAQKVGEEGVETAMAALAESDELLLGESADLIFHLTVLLRSRGLSLRDVKDVLRERHAQAG
jgi:phosphoribosyl-ATP pyrophosphohydrolase/phosphoribosyl-AMP cyclohydrolase